MYDTVQRELHFTGIGHRSGNVLRIYYFPLESHSKLLFTYRTILSKSFKTVRPDEYLNEISNI